MKFLIDATEQRNDSSIIGYNLHAVIAALRGSSNPSRSLP